jgi:aminoglycoside phosphotransferase (APT) family kinase protein
LIDEHSVSDALVRALPSTAPVSSIERINQGWGNLTWFADTAIGRLVVKVGLPTSDIDKWRSAAAGVELARAHGVPTPELLAFVDEVPSLDHRILRVFRHLAGSTPRVDESSSRLFEQLGSVVRQLHTISLPRFTSRVGGAGFDRWSEFIEDRWVPTLGRVALAGIDPTLVARAKGVADSLAAAVDGVAAPTLCHRDLYLDNLLIDDDGALVALLDFDLVEVWDPLVEFFKLEWFVFEPIPAARESFMSGYLAGAPLPPMFEERVRLASIVELVNHAASWRLTDKPDIADEALDRLRSLLLEHDDL